jgi:hypothetical protein
MNRLTKLSARTFLSLILFLTTISTFAQGGKISIDDKDYANKSVEMADFFRQDGKIYVVVAVLLTIFVGMIVFLLMTERRVSKLEKIAFKDKQNHPEEHAK